MLDADIMVDTPHLLLVDDERSIREPLAQYLVKQGFRVTQVGDAEAARMRLGAYAIDLVILDIMMPGEDGLSLCRHIRATSDIPVILLTAKSEETDRIVGLEVGADDYLAKPFNARELLARVRAALRRLRAGSEAAAGEEAAIYRFAGWTLSAGNRSLTAPDGALVNLTGGEFDLLLALVSHPQRVVTRDQLLDWTRGKVATPFDRAVDVQLSRLRRKIGDDPREPALIRTVRGDGYLFSPPVVRC